MINCSVAFNVNAKYWRHGLCVRRQQEQQRQQSQSGSDIGQRGV